MGGRPISDFGGQGVGMGGLAPPFLADVICEKPLTSSRFLD